MAMPINVSDLDPPDPRDPNADVAGKAARDFTPKGLDEPTDAPCGTKEKVEALRRRLDEGKELHHPDDATYETAEDFIELRRPSVPPADQYQRVTVAFRNQRGTYFALPEHDRD